MPVATTANDSAGEDADEKQTFSDSNGSEVELLIQEQPSQTIEQVRIERVQKLARKFAIPLGHANKIDQIVNKQEYALEKRLWKRLDVLIDDCEQVFREIETPERQQPGC